MLLDAPTNFLDSSDRLKVLELCHRLNHDDGRTVGMVLHDLNQVTRFAHLNRIGDGRQ